MANNRYPTRSLMALKAVSETQAAAITSRRDWLRQVVNPTFCSCREIAQSAFQDLASALRRAEERDYDTANRLWTEVRRRFAYCADYLAVIHGLSDWREFSEAAELLGCLRQFFTIGTAGDAPSGEQPLRGLGTAWQCLSDPSSQPDDDSLEVLDAELLHAQLKWAIVCNRHLLIDSSTGAGLQRARR